MRLQIETLNWKYNLKWTLSHNWKSPNLILFCLFVVLTFLPNQGFGSVEVPKAILGLQEVLAYQGECESSWRENLMNAQKFDLDPDVQLFLLPCARWTHNAAWTAYLQINEPSRSEGVLIKSIRFVDYSPTKGVFGSDHVYNIEFDPEAKTLTSHFFLNGKEHCGHHSIYKWNSGQQALLLSKLIGQDDCSAVPKNWKMILQNNLEDSRP